MAEKYPPIPIEQVGARRVRSGGSPQKYVLDEPGRRLILAVYDGSRGSISELHRRLGVPRWVVSKWASQLGLARQRAPRWTQEEIKYLEKHFRSKKISEIAAHLGRSEASVHNRASELGLYKLDGEGYTLTAVCEGMGCHHDTVTRWIKQGWLKASRRHTDRAIGDPYFVTDKALRDFFRSYPSEFDLRRVDQLWFLSICLDVGALDNPMDR